MEQVLTKTTELEKIQTGLKAFEGRKESLIALAASAKTLDIQSIDDKQALKQITEKRKELKAARVLLQKEGKSMRDLIRPITEYISSSEKELVAIIEPEEIRLQGREAWVESELEFIRVQEVQREEARIQKRIDALAQFGYQIDYADIKAMTDETFDKYLEAAKAQFEKEQAQRLEEERIRKEQEEKERLEREAQAAELQRLRKEAEEREAKIRAMEEEKQKAEQEKRQAELAKQREEELRIAQEQAAEKARLKAIEDAKEAERLRLEKEEKERIAAERKAARQPDKVKIQKYISDIKAVAVPEMKTDEGKTVMASIQELIAKFDTYATQKADML